MVYFCNKEYLTNLSYFVLKFGTVSGRTNLTKYFQNRLVKAVARLTTAQMVGGSRPLMEAVRRFTQP